MIKILIIADDFTGALDTGVQFAAMGAGTRVITGHSVEYDQLDEKTQVLVLDAETRHMTAAKAREVVSAAVRDARAAGVTSIYKKTDSALRGNIGSELEAMCAEGIGRVHFAPAFPKMNRLTKQGVHYIDGVPVGESVFGKDPFEPVRHSDVKEIIEEQSELPVYKAGSSVPDDVASRQGILLYDSENDEQLTSIAKTIWSMEPVSMCAGCAGFASAITPLLGLTKDEAQTEHLPKALMVVCGSVNPITVSQLCYAEQAGIERIPVRAEWKLAGNWAESEEGKKLIHSWSSRCQEQKVLIVDSNDPAGSAETADYVKSHGMSVEEMRVTISEHMGAIARGLLEDGLDAAYLITGGDILMGFMQQIGVRELVPIRELAPGVVLSGLSYKNRMYYVISKSGGFGKESLIPDLVKMICE